jgi:hypothetical protein
LNLSSTVHQLTILDETVEMIKASQVADGERLKNWTSKYLDEPADNELNHLISLKFIREI